MKRILPATFIICLLSFVAAMTLPSFGSAQVSSSYARRFGPTTFAALGTPANNAVRWCSNCQAASPCTSGGSGAYAYRVGGAWNCSNGGSGASISGTAGDIPYFATSSTLGGSPLKRGDANTVEQYNSTNAQSFYVYNTRTDASNYERAVFGYASNVLKIGHQYAGTGAGRNIDLMFGGSVAGLLRLKDGDGNVRGTFDNTAAAWDTPGGYTVNGGIAYFNANGLDISGAMQILARPAAFSAVDAGLRRAADSVWGLNNGTTGGGTFRTIARTPAQITSDQNNYNPGGTSLFQRWSTDASRNITGLVFTDPQVDGQHHVIVNVGAQDVVLVNESASSTSTNRFTNSTGANITLSAKQAADVVYDGTTSRWLVFKRN